MAYTWEDLEELFEQSLEIPEAERSTFLARSCPDNEELKRTLLQMLKQSDEAEQHFFDLQQKVISGLSSGSGVTEIGPGLRVGSYEIVKELGKGGMGVVFLVKRVDGEFDHLVAIKFFRKALFKDLLLDFRHEQSVLASLKHPSIAQIYDGGVYNEELAYFVMEYVEGIPIHEYVEKQQLSRNSRLNLFLEVCRAVEFSHRNLILHCDIKPGNILVTKEGFVKLLDFGISSFLIRDEVEEGQETRLLGTPQYASPEQLKGQKTSTASDVYQLGILLHKLLSQEFPWEQAEEGRQQMDTELSRKLKIAKGLPFELLAIVEKALAEEPEERYRNVENLFQDISHYQHHYPVKAVQAGKSYPFKKYVERNKYTVATTAFTFLVLLAGVVSSLWQARIAQEERERAEQTAAFVKSLFVSADPFESQEKDYRSFSVYDFLSEKKEGIFQDSEMPPEALSVAREMGSLAEKEGNSLWKIKKDYLLGKAYSLEYNFEEARLAYQKAYQEIDYLQQKDPYAAASLLQDIALNRHLNGEYDSAEIFYKAALKDFEQHEMQDTEEAVNCYNCYSQLLRSTGRYDSALLMADKAIAYKIKKGGDSADMNLVSSFADRALIYMETGAYKKAEKDFQKAIGIGLQQLDSANQNLAIILGNFAILKNLQQKYSEAEDLNQRLLEMALAENGPAHPDVAYARLQLAESLLGQQRLKEAEEEVNKGILSVEEILRPNHYLNGILYLLRSRINILKGDFSLAKSDAEKSLEVFESSLPADHYRIGLAKVRYGISLAESGEREKGMKMVRQGIPLLEASAANTKSYRQEAAEYLQAAL